MPRSLSLTGSGSCLLILKNLDQGPDPKVAQWAGWRPAKQKVAGSIPGAWVVGFGPYK